ncbi:MAG: ATP-binding cassette domain-containing protein [Pseudomonadota bacterium]
MGGDPVHPAPVLRLEGVAKRRGGVGVLRAVDLDVAAGECVAIVARRGAGRSTLASILTGQRLPDRGRLWRTGPAAPPVGQPCGLGTTGHVERDLALRAAAWGLDSGSYTAAVVDAIARLPAFAGGQGMRARRALLARPFDQAPAPARAVLVHAAALCVPAPLYVADGPVLPGEAGAAAAVAPLFDLARGRSGVVALLAGASQLRRTAPDRVLWLVEGRLAALPDVEAGIAALEGRLSLAAERSVAARPAPARPDAAPPTVGDAASASRSRGEARPGAAVPAAPEPTAKARPRPARHGRCGDPPARRLAAIATLMPGHAGPGAGAPRLPCRPTTEAAGAPVDHATGRDRHAPRSPAAGVWRRRRRQDADAAVSPAPPAGAPSAQAGSPTRPQAGPQVPPEARPKVLPQPQPRPGRGRVDVATPSQDGQRCLIALMRRGAATTGERGASAPR